ncbi:MAG: MFS transporter [Clostridiales bacterium]|nr:MFS transporter [Clostridiales bacterium]
MSSSTVNSTSTVKNTRHVTLIEYISIAMSRIGDMFSTTLTGTLATAFLHELYYGPAGVNATGVAQKIAVQTTITTVASIFIGLISGVIVQKWKTKLGNYRQWYFINLIPMFALTVLYFWVPGNWSIKEMTYWRYGIALAQTIFSAFNTLSQNISQVISPDPKEKKLIATFWQIFYYIGYGGAYLATMIYGKFSDDKNAMYMRLALVAAIVASIGRLMVGIFCKERIEIESKKKEKISKELLQLFKYKNYRAYQYMNFSEVLMRLGKFSTYLAAITVGSANNLLLTLPTAAGTIVGNLITAKLSKKHEPTKLLKANGFFCVFAASLVFLSAFIQYRFGLLFFEGWNKWFFYVFYFLFGIGVGINELSMSHFKVEYFDYLEWQTGRRLEAVQSIIPDWIKSALSYIYDIAIPFILVKIGYESSAVGNLVETMRLNPGYMKTCLWLLALLVFTYAAANLFKAIFLKTMYNVEGETKQQMYLELTQRRENKASE